MKPCVLNAEWRGIKQGRKKERGKTMQLFTDTNMQIKKKKRTISGKMTE